MTCKDCIYDGVCHIQEMSTGLEMEEYLKEFGCEDFKNKADFVEVVRCKDCKYYVSNYCTRDVKGRTNMFYMTETDFCSYGEKR